MKESSHKNSITSMAFILFFTLLITSAELLNEASAQQQRGSNITLGSSLTPSSNISWFSPSSQFAFGFYPQSNGLYGIGIFLANISQRTVVWTANRDNNPTVSGDVVLTLTRDGRFVVQERGAQDIDVSGVSQPIALASMQDNGNFVLFNSDMRIIWQSFDYPTDTLLPGQPLLTNHALFSSVSETDHRRGIFTIIMQYDGNLVQYLVSNPYLVQNAYYSSQTVGSGHSLLLNLDRDGRLYLVNGSSLVMNITPGGYPTTRTITLMRIDADGIFRVYARSLDFPERNWTTLWSSTEDRCVPKGLCGLNQFCNSSGEGIECRCIPGFDYVQSGNWSAGCSRTFTAESCPDQENRASRATYDIITVNNAVWIDASYAVINGTTENGCRQACLQDCNCEAAAFNDGICSKQRLPLLFGRKSIDESNMALIKVFTPVSQSGKETKKNIRSDILIISILLCGLSVLVLVISVVYVRRTRVGAYRRIWKNGEVNLVEDVSLRAFSYAEIVNATDDFKEELGRGASGTVYKGIFGIDIQKLVAVKRLEIKEVIEGEKEFQNELKLIGKMYHRNLVRLLGYCFDSLNRILVFEYMRNGSLADVLFKSEYKPSWEERIKIARDIARGILYLHEECEMQIIHCDIKPQNMLMDENNCAKISDFGLSKLLKQDQTKTYTGIRGTKGYVAPEWHKKAPVTVKADVYSFGVVLLEIICCRRCVDCNLPEDEVILEDWVYSCYEAGEMRKLMGDEEIEESSLENMVKIGIWCIQAEPSLRPSIKKVLLMLEGTIDIPVPPSPNSFYGSM